MNPMRRTQWSLLFAELRAWISAIPEARHAATAVCDGCGKRLFLVRGRHSGKYFFSHDGLSGCESARAVFFDNKQEAETAREVFK
jgi:hypothetical protein